MGEKEIHAIIKKYNDGQRTNSGFWSKTCIFETNYKGYIGIKTEGDTGLYTKPDLLDVIDAIIANGRNEILWDIKELRYGRGLLMGQLIGACKKCYKSGGNLIVIGVDENHKTWKVFEDADMLKYVHFCQNVDEDIDNVIGFLVVRKS